MIGDRLLKMVEVIYFIESINIYAETETEDPPRRIPRFSHGLAAEYV